MFDLDGLEVSGVSVGGVASCVDLPGLKSCVDLGVILDRTVARDVVLITHAHADHLGSLVQHVAQRGLRGMAPATYVVPPGIEGDVEALLEIWRRLDGGELAATIRPLPPAGGPCQNYFGQFAHMQSMILDSKLPKPLPGAQFCRRPLPLSTVWTSFICFFFDVCFVTFFEVKF